MTLFAFSSENAAIAPVSPLKEMGAYEALWLEQGASFKRIAERFANDEAALPSDFVPMETSSRTAQEVLMRLKKAGVHRFGVRIHHAGDSQVPVLRYAEQHIGQNRLFFPERNATMSALTEATIIVEASDTSGTLTQARAAIHQGRKLFILNSCFEYPAITWPARFEAQGAIRVRNMDDVSTRSRDTVNRVTIGAGVSGDARHDGKAVRPLIHRSSDSCGE